MAATKKQIRDAISERLAVSADISNYGMMSRMSMSIDNNRILRENNIRINGNTVYQNETPIYRIERRYATRKTNGCYKELKAKLVEI